MPVRHHFKDDQQQRSEASQTPITIHILKIAFQKIIREHKDKDKDTDEVPERPTYAIFLKS